MIKKQKQNRRSYTALYIFLLVSFFSTSVFAQDPVEQDSIQPKTGYNLGKLNMPNPISIVGKYTYDPLTDRYFYSETLGKIDLGYPLILTPEEFEQLVLQEHMQGYYKDKLDAMEGKKEGTEEAQGNLLPDLYVNSRFFESIFGGNTIEVIPQGNIGMDIGILYTKNDNPAFSPQNRSNFSFDFDQRISLSLLGKVGKRLQVAINYDTEAIFDFQEQVKLEYTPTEDDIIRKIEVGNVSLPLNSALITGAQSLFGVKTELQFGKTSVTAVYSEQKSQRKTVTAQGGGTLEEFELFALDYDENRHFFLAQYFRDNYNKALKDYPFIQSNVQITRLEVWVTNRSNATANVRNIVALQDIGESDPTSTGVALDANGSPIAPPPGFFISAAGAFPDNANNGFNPLTINGGSILTQAIRDIATVDSGFGTLTGTVSEGIDYAKLENARKLTQGSEFSLNTQLGYISLNQKLNNDEVLAVAYQYTVGGQVYQVGEFANDGVDAVSVGGTGTVSNQSLVLKMLKSNLVNVNEPVWDLMMKNVYPLGAYQLSADGFKLDILYTDPSPLNYITSADGGTTPLPAGVSETSLLQVFSVDKLNVNNDPQAGGDGFFDFFPGITVNTETGSVIFPVIEPFGESLYTKLKQAPTDPDNYDLPGTYNPNQTKYVYRSLYESTKIVAMEDASKNKFQLKGRYKSSGGGGIQIGAFNVPRGSVTVTAGGRQLVEGIDYTVDYQLGRVQILDEALKASNIPINISVENNALFGQQTRRFAGVNVVHKFNDDFQIGGTFLNLNERPLTQKAAYGYEPINNSIFGFNGNYSTEIPLITRLVNKLPNIDTDVPSKVSVRGEFAALMPGAPKRTQLNGEATTYIDDFEASQTAIDVKSALSWRLSSAPIGLGGELPNNDLASGFRRSKMAWYSIDPIFYSNQRPDGISDDDVSTLETHRVFINDVIEQDVAQGQTLVLNTLDMAYYPNDRGPYNNISAMGPASTNWAGITRQLTTTNFEQANIEYLEFWVLDPHYDDGVNNIPSGGKLYINLGSVSEDVLKDGRKLYENGLPKDGSALNTTPTSRGKVPTNQSLIYAFDSEGAERTNQDVGLDGLSDAEEAIARDPNTNQLIYDNGPANDPAGDNYTYFLNTEGNILQRYVNYNGTQGNSPVEVSDTNRGSTTQPDVEDLNRDNTMNTIDSYYEYEINMVPGITPGATNARYLKDAKVRQITMPNGDTKDVRWLQYRIPLRDANANAVNGINDLRSVRFMRMYMTGFDRNTVLRFGTLDLVRGDWRTYTQTLDNLDADPNDDGTDLLVSAINNQENALRTPIPYVLPPGIQLEELFNNNTVLRQKEQSLSVRVKDLEANDARAVFKNISIDMLQFKKLRMFVHAEEFSGDANDDLGSDEVSVFIRMGNDLTTNYYQIELPLKQDAINPVDGLGNSLSSTVGGDPELIWPNANRIELPLEALKKVKASRISPAGILPGTGFYNVTEGGEVTPVIDDTAPITTKYRVSIVGNPSLGNIRTLMLGVKNRAAVNKSVEVWFNELRLSDMDNKGGWAALMAADMNIADFATVALNGKTSTIGFGSLEQGPNERSRDDVKQYDVVTNVNIGQLLPKKWGINLPFNYGIGEEIITPKFDPLYQDVELQTIIDQDPDNETFYKNRAQNYTKRKSINFIGVRKDRVGQKKSRFYDVENFTASYSYNQTDHRDYEIEDLKEQNIRAGVTYGYGFKNKPVEPLKKVKFLSKSKYLKILKDINFNVLPSNLSFNANYTRLFNKQRFRNVDQLAGGIPLPDLYKRNYLFDWQYTINHSLTKSLQFNFSANRNNIVRNYITPGPIGDVVDNSNTIWDGFFDTGDPNRHSQQLQVNYDLPLNKLPFLSALKSTYAYTGDFQWTKGSELLNRLTDENGVAIPPIGNSIQNAQTHTFNASLDMRKFYKYIGFEKKDFKRTFATKLKNKKDRTNKKISKLRAIDTLTTRQKSKLDKFSERLVAINKKSSQKPKANFANKLYNTGVGILSSVKKVQVNYNENRGSHLPGYLNNIGFIGTLRPSWGYVFGSQSEAVRYEAAQKGWLTLYQNFNEQFTSTKVRQLTMTANLEPLKDLKIDLNANRTYQHNYSENFRVVNSDPLTGTGGTYQALTPNTFGSFSVSTLLIRTSFSQSDETQSAAFETFKSNRLAVAMRLAQQRGIDVTNPANLDAEGFPLGYGKTSQQVLLPAFLSAYSGQDEGKVRLSPFRNLPLPNWNVKYTGLMRLKWFKKRFKRFSLAHGYKASYTVNQFRTNLELQANPGNLVDQSGNFRSEILLSNVNLTEEFSPLIKVDMEMKNSINIGAEMRKDRALALSFDNNLMTEIQGKQYILKLGYRIKDLRFNTRIGGKLQRLKGDLNIKTDVSLRNNKTIVRYLDLSNNQITAGQKLWSAKLAADYALTKNFTTMFYFDYAFSDAVISTSFPQTTIRSGFRLTYTFN